VGRRLRTVFGLLVLAELVVYVLVASWIGVGATILATLATSALGGLLLTRQGTKALGDLRERARSRQPSARAVGDAGLVGVGGVLMLLPGFLGDVVGLLCLLPGTRNLVRWVLVRTVYSRLPEGMRGPVRVRSARVEQMDGHGRGPGGGTGSGPVWRPGRPTVIEGEIAPGPSAV
jgi:UPF0716 protein FxsA